VLPAVLGVFLERVLDKARAELGKLDATMAGGVRKETGFGHAGNGVRLERYGLAFRRDDEVGPGCAATPECPVGALGEDLCLRVGARIKPSRDHVMHGGWFVLHLEVVELRTRHYLDDGKRMGVIVADNGNGDLGALDATPR